MWLFTRYGFFSISVQGDKIVVRARLEKHLLALKTRMGWDDRIVIYPRADYRYRLIVNRAKYEQMVLAISQEQTWGNFKDEVARFGGRDEYERALHEIWWIMLDLQKEEKGGTRRRRITR